ncbi:hypothetical protein [Morganella morganii]|uniref:hypothetical protein n=1 Tax=Morganella morganii TaxID=582 RepID=UPI001F120F7B|nr:hypothetical protein [Morganella morganii]
MQWLGHLDYPLLHSITDFMRKWLPFFDHHDLMMMQEVSGTVLYAEYVAAESGMLLVDGPVCDTLDRTDLFERGIKTSVYARLSRYMYRQSY